MNSNRLINKTFSFFNKKRYSIIEINILTNHRKIYEKNYSKSFNNPLISVYVPTYNRGNILIERAVPSVLSQTYNNFEFVIIGDCCTDNTEELIKNLSDPRIKFYNIPFRKYRYPPSPKNNWFAGPVVAANKALSIIKGDWIARIDDDDMWTETHLDDLLNYAISNSFEFISANYQALSDGNQYVVKGKRACSDYYYPKIEPFKYHSNDYNPRIGGTCTWMYRSYLKFMKYNINCWRKTWNQVNDTDLSVRMFEAGVRMGHLDKVISYVYPRPGEKLIGLSAYLSAEAENRKPHA